MSSYMLMPLVVASGYTFKRGSSKTRIHLAVEVFKRGKSEALNQSRRYSIMPVPGAWKLSNHEDLLV
jgi:hypothetical protein